MNQRKIILDIKIKGKWHLRTFWIADIELESIEGNKNECYVKVGDVNYLCRYNFDELWIKLNDLENSDYE